MHSGRRILPLVTAVLMVCAALGVLARGGTAPAPVSHAQVLHALSDSGVLVGAGHGANTAPATPSWHASWYVYGRHSQPHSFQGLLVQVAEMPSGADANAVARQRRPLRASAVFEDYVVTVDGSPVSDARVELARVLHSLRSAPGGLTQ